MDVQEFQLVDPASRTAKASEIIVNAQGSNDKLSHPKNRDYITIVEYVLKKVPEFRRLSELRQKGWNNPKGDRFFEKQRQTADFADKKTAKGFYKMMISIANQMNDTTGVLYIKKKAYQDRVSILDMCMAPGGFLKVTLSINHEARALAFSLPEINGGHAVLLRESPNVTCKFHDITMLAEDMGISNIPCDHPDAENFLPSQFEPGQSFDLILCDGQVLRTHSRFDYRKSTEATRLRLTQLALALDHLKPGGTIIVLLHKVEAPDTVRILHTFNKFASVQLFKHDRFHAKRSSFYMLATNINTDSENAKTAIERWKTEWKIATFGADHDNCEANHIGIPDIDVILKEFGPRLVELGREIWDIQANALQKAPFTK